MKKEFADLIEVNPKVMLGKPVIKGTRITVELILDKMSNGEGIEAILLEHPRLVREHVLAALAFAAEELNSVSRSRLVAEFIDLNQDILSDHFIVIPPGATRIRKMQL